MQDTQQLSTFNANSNDDHESPLKFQQQKFFRGRLLSAIINKRPTRFQDQFQKVSRDSSIENEVNYESILTETDL